MGIELIKKVKNRLRKEYKMAFILSFIGGLLIHMYKFTNNLPNHDSMYNFYSDQNVVGSGRWFLSIACGFSSYYDLPWINGILSIFYIALTAVVVVNILEIKNPIAIAISCGLLVSYPAITETLCFGFTADGYMLALLLSALSIYAIIKCNNTIKSIILGSVFICLTCGIYQAYVSFAIVLFLCWFILAAFCKEFDLKIYLKHCGKFVTSIIIGLGAFYFIWKLCLLIQGVPANNYQGINEIGLLNPSEIVASIKKVSAALFTVILEKNILKHDISLYGILNILFIIFSITILIISIVKSKIYKNISNLLSVIICIFLFPFAVCMWQFVSPDVVYSFRMMQSVTLFYILIVILCERFIKGYLSIIFAVLNMLIIANLSIQANVAYYYLNYEYENSYAEAVQLEYAITQVCKQYDNKYPVAIIGHRENNVALDQTTEANDCFMYTTMIEKSFLVDSEHTKNFLKNILYFDKEFADSQTIAKIETTSEYANMKPWFEGGTIEVIDEIITVKLG